MNNVTITTGPKNFRIENRAGVEYINLGNVERAAEIVADYFGADYLYATLVDYLDAGCELVDIELEDGEVIINALKNGCNVGEYNATPLANTDEVDLVALFASLPNLN